MASKKAENAQGNVQSFPNAAEICKIIAACREAGVVSFTMGQMVILWDLAEVNSPAFQAESGASPTPEAEVPVETIRAKQAFQEKLSHEEQEIEAKERRIEELLLEDPLLAEEMMRDGELEKLGESDGSDDGSDGEAFD